MSGSRCVMTRASAFLIALAAIAAGARMASADEPGEVAVAAAAWAQGGYSWRSTSEIADSQDGSYLGMARLAAGATYAEQARAFLQIEGISGDARLLDLVAEIRLAPGFTARVGRFRVPTSADLQVAAPHTPFVNRARLVVEGYVPNRRVGIESEFRRTLAAGELSVRGGWFEVSERERARFEAVNQDVGRVANLRGLLEMPGGWAFHLAAAKLLGADNAPAPDPGAPDDSTTRPVAFDAQVDAAVGYAEAGWNFDIEGVVAVEGPGDRAALAGYVSLLKAFELGADGRMLEPGARYEVLRADGATTHSAVVGLNYYWLGDYISASVNYELLRADGDFAHAGYLQLQVGFEATASP